MWRAASESRKTIASAMSAMSAMSAGAAGYPIGVPALSWSRAVAHDCCAFGAGRPGAHGVDAHSMRAEFRSPGLGEQQQCGLARAVESHAGQSEIRDHGRDVDDGARSVRDHPGSDGSHEQERRGIGGCLLGSLAGALAESDPLARTALARSFAEWERLLRVGLETMRDHGELRADIDAEGLATSILASVQGGLLLSQTRRDSATVGVAVDMAIAYLETLRADDSPAP
jgi:hypothetical protein